MMFSKDPDPVQVFARYLRSLTDMQRAMAIGQLKVECGFCIECGREGVSSGNCTCQKDE